MRSRHAAARATYDAALGDQSGEVRAAAGFERVPGQLLDRLGGDDEPVADADRWEGVVVYRAVEGVGVAAQNLRRLADCVERRRTGIGHGGTHDGSPLNAGNVDCDLN